MSDMFSENPPVIPLAPRRPTGSSDTDSIARERITEVTNNQKTAGSLAAKIAAAKAAHTSPFVLTRTVPGEQFEVRVRRPSLMFLATSGRLPTTLQNIVSRMFEDDADAVAVAAAIEAAAKNDLPMIAALVQANAIEGFVDPRLVPAYMEPGPDELRVTEIDMEDLLEFFTWCNGGASEESDALAEFHEAGQARPVGPVDQGAGEQSATFRNPETAGV